MQASRPCFIIGLMAGTSIDGIDASLVKTDGTMLARTGHALTLPYRDETRRMIFAAMADHKALSANETAMLNTMIADDHASVVETLMEQAGIRPDCIGFHGQTIFHDPENGLSIQMGEAQRLAERLTLPVVHQFRQADLAAGGQGAPIAPVYHRMLIETLNLPLPAVIANIGGITNMTRWDGENLTGFDSGPGNALMDQLARQVLGEECDRNGALAGEGSLDEAWVQTVLDHPYFALEGAKSLDRGGVFDLIGTMPEGADADRMASLTALTAASIARSLKGIKAAVLCGGGARNPVLVAMIRARTDAAVTVIDDHGGNDPDLNGDFIEAELMAFLAERSRRGLAITFPGTTGVDAAMTGGMLTLPK